MNIQGASEQTGLPAKTIRYYEDIGLIQPDRAANGYRHFNTRDLHNLTFLARARALGFTIEDCRALLGLYEDESRASAEVKTIAQKHLQAIEEKIRDLQTMRETLSELVTSCHGDNRPDCPILSDLGGALQD